MNMQTPGPSSRRDASFGTFIVTTSHEKQDLQTRKFIRSYVMRGRNTRQDRRARGLVPRTTRADEDQSQAQGLPSLQTTIYTGKEYECTLTTPQKIACEVALFRYGAEVKPYMLETMYRAFTIVKPTTHTIELVLLDNTHDKFFCFSNISSSPAMIHSLLFTAQAYHDLSLSSCYGRIAQFHLAKAFYYLQQSLDDKADATTDSTMAVVISLAAAAALLGDLDTAQKHMDGLYRMIQLRGGLKCIEKNSMMEHKAQRLDFGLALRTGSEMRFVREGISWGPRIARGKRLDSFPELRVLNPRLDPRLFNVWADLKEFSKSANEALTTKTRLPASFFSPLCTSIPQRLISLRFDPTSLSELLRLCMLAFVKNILIQLDGIGRQLTILTNGLKVALLAQQFPPAIGNSELLLWALVIAASSIFEGFDQDWLRKALVKTCSSLCLQTWTETRVILKRFLWIDMVHDDKGEEVIEKWGGMRSIETDREFNSITSALF